MFDYTYYFVIVGLFNTVQLRLLGNYPGTMLELLESLLFCLVWHFFAFLFRCNKDALFNLRASSLTESDSCKNASGFQTPSNFQLLNRYWPATLQLVTTGSVMVDRNDEVS